MDTKKAIELIKEKFEACIIEWLYGKHINAGYKELDEVVSLIEELEKYKAICKKLEKGFYEEHCNFFSEHCYSIIKQKYFPKENKNETKKEKS